MGTFDWIKCHYPLPDAGANALNFQTKNLECDMDTYTITAEGRLIQHAFDRELVPEAERPYPEAPLIGMFRRVNKRDVDTDYHGDLFMCAPAPDGQWIEYRVRFTHGAVESVMRLSDVYAPDAPA